ncbi:hypothetical protein L1987_06382 [Smallanthus sonchifolius]|uniref:Uncharacterized protein n=1 Tax=Smallanthus sonchifolius TaxID=185202 RepID=A0ACB9JXZ3_9ASTR|nr:hypothetical protein L1987_06382 [Smallanthus sonchifolius]
MIISKQLNKNDFGGSSSVKEKYEADISTEVGKGKVIEICDSSEVREVFPKLPAMRGKALDPKFKEIEDEEKGMETDIGGEGKKDLKKSRAEASGVSRYKYKVRRSGRLTSKALSRKGKGGTAEKSEEKRKRIDSEWTESSEESTEKKKKMKKENEINVQKHKIKIDCAAIHQLLGVSCGEVTIESMTKLKISDESVKSWRNRYPGNFVASTELLLYVDSVECKGIKMDRKMNPISFWNMSRLKERQKWEIENGGFGKGKYKRFTKLIEDEDEDERNSGYSVVDEIEGGTNDENRDLENDNSGGDDKTDTEQEDGGNDSSARENQDDEEETGDSEDNAWMINDDEKGVEELYESDTISLGHGELGEAHTCQDTGVESLEKTTGEGEKQDVVEAPEEKKDITTLKEDDSVKDKLFI